MNLASRRTWFHAARPLRFIDLCAKGAVRCAWDSTAESAQALTQLPRHGRCTAIPPHATVRHIVPLPGEPEFPSCAVFETAAENLSWCAWGALAQERHTEDLGKLLELGDLGLDP